MASTGLRVNLRRLQSAPRPYSPATRGGRIISRSPALGYRKGHIPGYRPLPPAAAELRPRTAKAAPPRTQILCGLHLDPGRKSRKPFRWNRWSQSLPAWPVCKLLRNKTRLLLLSTSRHCNQIGLAGLSDREPDAQVLILYLGTPPKTALPWFAVLESQTSSGLLQNSVAPGRATHPKPNVTSSLLVRTRSTLVFERATVQARDGGDSAQWT